MDIAGPSDRARLVRCLVENPQGETSIRYVELDYFKLWEYLVQHKHGLAIRQTWLALWCAEAEFARHASAFARAGDAEPVDRLHLELFDARRHYTLGVDRYLPRDDVALVRKTLLEHVPDSLRDENACRIQHTPGYGVVTGEIDESHPIVLGLHGEAAPAHHAER